MQKSSKMFKACRVKEVHRVFSFTDMKYLKDGKRMPIYLRKHPGMKETFNACTVSVNVWMICQKLILRVKENTAFILDQNTCRILHPFDFQVGNLGGSFKRCDKVKIYKCPRNDDGLLLSTEAHVSKERNDMIVIGGIVNCQIAGKWCERDAELESLFVLARKR